MTFKRALLLCSVCVLSACSPQSSSQYKPENAQQSVDQQILDASKKIQAAQTDLYQAGALNNPVKKEQAYIENDKQPVTIKWDGDAKELLETMAKDRGLQFNVMGVRVPLPVKIDAKDKPYKYVIEQIRSQAGYHADITQYTDMLVLHYNPPLSKDKE